MKTSQTEAAVNKQPFEYTLSIISGKWKMRIIYFLGQVQVARYGELKKEIAGITHKMLSAQLKELEAQGIVIRKEYPQIPPKVEYSLTEKGLSLQPLITTLCLWGKKYQPLL